MESGEISLRKSSQDSWKPVWSLEEGTETGGPRSIVRIHDLRHTFASRLVSSGVPIFDVSKLLGHMSITMTMRYAHLSPNAFESAIIRLEEQPDAVELNGSGDIIDLNVEQATREAF